MSTVAAFVRLALILELLLGAQALAQHAATGLILPGHASRIRKHDTGMRICRSFQLCHSSKGLAWTSVQLFSALEPLMSKLHLEPMTEYLDIIKLQGCIKPGCCCSTPVEVRVSLPVHKDKQTAEAELALVTEYFQQKLAHATKDTVCTSEKLVDCQAPPKPAQQKPPSSKDDDDMPPLPPGLIPYDGKKPIPELEDPPLPAALVSFDGKKPPVIKDPVQKPSAQKPPVKKAPVKAAEEADLPLPTGLVPYDGKKPAPQPVPEADQGAVDDISDEEESASAERFRRQLQAELRAIDESSDDGDEDAATAALPHLPSGFSSLGGVAVLESAAVGTYGSASPAGTYAAAAAVGGYGRAPAAGTYAAASSSGQRNTTATAAPKKAASRSLLASSAPAVAKDLKAAQPSTQASSTANTRSSTGSTARSAGQPAGTCYCRYDLQAGAWALEQAACRAALFRRCKSTGPMLDCDQVEAFYKGLGQPGTEPPHAGIISAFLYVDCPPAPPCSCRSLVSNSETPTSHARCCADLKAHCQLPFSGLECEDVARFCRPGINPQDPVGPLFSYIMVKTHGLDCTDPRYSVAYTTVVTSSRTVEADAAVRELARAALAEGQHNRGHSTDPDRVATLLTMLVGGLFTVCVTALGTTVLYRIMTYRQQSPPLLA